MNMRRSQRAVVRKQSLTAVLMALAGTLFALLTLPGNVRAQDYGSLGGDIFISGSSPTLESSSPRDVFVTGFSPSAVASVAGDLHMTGFDVVSSSTVGEDFYGFGASVTISAATRQDLSVAGFTVLVERDAMVNGNARILAGTATINAPIKGSLIVTAGEIKLNSVIEGDVKLSAASIAFGDNARIDGKLTYSAADKIELSETVIAPERVLYIPTSNKHFFEHMKNEFDLSAEDADLDFSTVLFGFVVTLACLLVVAAVCHTFFPNTIIRLTERLQARPWVALLAGFVGLATLVGFVPVSVLTIVGIPLLPLVLLSILVLWILGYLLGAYVLTTRLCQSFAEPPSSPLNRLLLLAGGLCVLALLNFIPFIGWLINLAVVLFGLGAMTLSVAHRLGADPASQQATFS